MARKLAVSILHSCVNASAQFAGLAALTGSQDEVTKMIAEFDKRRKVVTDGLNKLPGVSCIVPKGAFYAFPNIKKTGWNAKELANALLDEAGVAVIGGPDFEQFLAKATFASPTRTQRRTSSRRSRGWMSF